MRISGQPCLTSLFFRVIQQKLTLTAIYRSHNSVDAWVKNIYALAKLLDDISKKISLMSGALSIISHSITIDMTEISKSRAKKVVDNRKESIHNRNIDDDPRGKFEIFIDKEAKEIVVKHLATNHPLNEYRSSKAENIERVLYDDYVLSNIQHAMYIGRQLAIAEQCLLSGRQYVQK